MPTSGYKRKRLCRKETKSPSTENSEEPGVIAILKNYCAKKDIRNDVLHQVGLVANAIPGVEELASITQRNSRTAITANKEDDRR